MDYSIVLRLIPCEEPDNISSQSSAGVCVPYTFSSIAILVLGIFIKASGVHVHGHKLYIVGVTRHDEELALPIARSTDLRVPKVRVEENSIRFRAISVQGIEEEQGVAEIGG